MQTADPPTMNLPWVESPFFSRELARRTDRLTVRQREMAARFHEDGYVVLEQVVPHALCDEVRAEMEVLYDTGEGDGGRIPDAWKLGAHSTRELATLPAVQDTLSLLYERRPIPFQTLDFKHGTQQMGHSDSIHFSSFPARFMCGVWVALEDVDAENGPLFYYPGSHALPEISLFDIDVSVDDPYYPRYAAYEAFQQELMAELDCKYVEFHATKGDALVWSSNVVHGGSNIQRAGSTRWSQVTHFLFADCIYYQPHSSNVPLGELKLLEITDLNTMTPVPQVYRGDELEIERLPLDRARLIRKSEFSDSPTQTPVMTKRSPLILTAIQELNRSSFGRSLLGAARHIRRYVSSVN
jgi:Phytanoyl-CoA dioxygenase (PhyH)